MEIHAHQVASSPGQNPDHRQHVFLFLSDMGKEFADGDDGPGSNAETLRYLLPRVKQPCDNEEYEVLEEF